MKNIDDFSFLDEVFLEELIPAEKGVGVGREAPEHLKHLHLSGDILQDSV